MPPAVAVPLAAAALTAGASAVAQNVQNKAAIKNNQTQQQAAVNNAQSAWQNAQNNYNSWTQANPSPFSGAKITGPTPGAYGNYSGPPLAAQILNTLNTSPVGTRQLGATTGQRAFLPAAAQPPPAASAPIASPGQHRSTQASMNPAVLSQILGT